MKNKLNLRGFLKVCGMNNPTNSGKSNKTQECGKFRLSKV
jgi:hypothetical protein